MNDVSISTFASRAVIIEENKVGKAGSSKERENKIDALLLLCCTRLCVLSFMPAGVLKNMN